MHRKRFLLSNTNNSLSTDEVSIVDRNSAPPVSSCLSVELVGGESVQSWDPIEVYLRIKEQQITTHILHLDEIYYYKTIEYSIHHKRCETFTDTFF